MSAAAALQHLIDRSPPGWRLVLEADLALRGTPKDFTGWILPGDGDRYLRTVSSYGVMPKGETPDPPGAWVDDAACKGKRMHYSVIQAHNQKLSTEERLWEKQMLRLCQSCPVLSDCQSWALQAVEPAVDHIAGGMTPRERWLHRRGNRAG